MHEIKLEFVYKWIPVLKEKGEEYHFPEKITPFMRKTYNHSAIYRWNIFRNEPDDEKLIYIGEAQELCPQRINGYLNPGPSQKTNKRIKEMFQCNLNKGLKIRLEIFQFNNIEVENFTLTSSDLKNKHVRKFLEELMVIIYSLKGFQILNL